MAINIFEMMSCLHMGVDMETETDPTTVPHVYTPGYVPVYTLRDMDGKVLLRGPVDVLTEESHWRTDVHGLYEDDYPIFFRG